MTRLRVLMASWEEVVEEFYRVAIDGGGHHLTIFNPWQKEKEFIAEVKDGDYDVVILTNLGLPWYYIEGLVSPVCKASDAKVIVMSGHGDHVVRKMAFKHGAVAFYLLPLTAERILMAIDSAVEGMTVLSR